MATLLELPGCLRRDSPRLLRRAYLRSQAQPHSIPDITTAA